MKNKNNLQTDEVVMLLFAYLERISDTMQIIANSFGSFSKTEYLDTADVMRILKVSESTVYRWTKQGKLKRIKIQGKLYYTKASIDKMME